MVGVDLFCGAGGMTLGAKLAGIRVAYAVEADVHAAATYALNHPEVQLFKRDIRDIPALPPAPAGETTVLFGGPPCQGFSTSNQRTRNRANQNNWMFREFIRLARLWNPDWLVFENVKGIVETDSGTFLQAVLQSFNDIGYAVTHGVLNAADFGVPQRRARLFVIGSAHGIRLDLPTPLFRRKLAVVPALADLPDLCTVMIRIFRLTGNGEW